MIKIIDLFHAVELYNEEYLKNLNNKEKHEDLGKWLWGRENGKKIRGSSTELFRSLSISVIRWNVIQFSRQLDSNFPSSRRRASASSFASREESGFAEMEMVRR